MRRQRMVLVYLLAFQFTACDRGSPISPDPHPTNPSPHALVGTWQYTGNNFPEDPVGKLTACMITQADVAPDKAASTADSIMRTAAALSWPAPVITFFKDGTYSKNTSASSGRITPQVVAPSETERGSSGTWVVSGAQLVLIEDGAESETTVLTFAVSGDELLLSRPAEGYEGFPSGLIYTTDGDPTSQFNPSWDDHCVEEVFGHIERIEFRYIRTGNND